MPLGFEKLRFREHGFGADDCCNVMPPLATERFTTNVENLTGERQSDMSKRKPLTDADGDAILKLIVMNEVQIVSFYE